MRFALPSLGFITLLFCVACSSLSGGDNTGSILPPPNIRVLQATETEKSKTNAINDEMQRPSTMMIGAESHHIGLNGQAELLMDSGLQLVRHNALLWEKVEPIEGARQWGEVAELEKKLENSTILGLSTILIVRGTPSWAQKVPGSACGPISQTKLASFANFLSEAVTRYSFPPYNVKYWELGNEPDVDPSLVRPDSVFGCWGDQTDIYYGGGYYAEMLKVVYPVIKAADPEAKVLIGGLLLDCDPTNPPEGADCRPGNFLEGILKNGGGKYFDIVSFHGYPPFTSWPSGDGGLYYDEQYPSWAHRGGVVLGKVDFLREVMESYGLNKPLIHTEGSLICPEYNSTLCDPPGEKFFDIQADYVVRLFVTNWANGLLGSIWYQFEGPGWRYGGLLDEDQDPKPAYSALQFLTKELSGATYKGEINSDAQVSGHEFVRNDKRIWVLWSSDEIPHMITLNQSPNVILDKYGVEINSSPTNDFMVKSPIYIEYSP